ncbi:uncharacterized protein LOC111585868 isoform X9 [Amphiprion ocellaris]|uniref:uncharacterized protein LOC111585868 isoform X9 n=1 Tax=Amphiprion ocellaris TaxID=80972 RepID=UPI002410D594|nr:uncharacterized protein LOC111585868 isoform X9 [Amphiprion ocellaris]
MGAGQPKIKVTTCEPEAMVLFRTLGKHETNNGVRRWTSDEDNYGSPMTTNRDELLSTEQCGKTSITATKLRIHQRIHTVEKLFRAAQMDKTLRLVSTLPMVNSAVVTSLDQHPTNKEPYNDTSRCTLDTN